MTTDVEYEEETCGMCLESYDDHCSVCGECDCEWNCGGADDPPW